MPTVSGAIVAAQANKRTILEHLRWCFDEDVLVVLDLEEGRYHAMDADAAARFIAFARGAQDAGMEASLLEAGLLCSRQQKERPMKPFIVPGQWPMAAKTILFARRHLIKKKFRLSLEWAMQHRPRRPLPNAISTFRWAEASFPSRLGDLDCLPRALGLFAFLRHAALSPEFVIGFKRHPFTAHAWVEVDGAPVLENQTGKNQVASFLEILRVC